MTDETLEAMCDNEIMQKLGWMSGVLADSGYGEQAGDVMRAMVFIHEQAQEIEKYKKIASKAIREQIDVRLAEQERCAKIAEQKGFWTNGDELAAAIRKNGEMSKSAYPDLAKVEDWLNGRGYTGEAGSCHAAMDEIRQLRAENEKLRQAMHYIYEVYAGSEGFKPETCPEAYLQERVKEMADIAAKHKRAALKETGDE